MLQNPNSTKYYLVYNKIIRNEKRQETDTYIQNKN